MPLKADFQFADLFLAFLRGVRFDLSTLAIVFILPVFLFLLPFGRKIFYILIDIYIYFSAFVMYVFLFGDLFYFEQAGRRTSLEIFIVGKNFGDVMQMGLGDYKLYLVFSLLIIFFIVIILGKTLRIKMSLANYKSTIQSFAIHIVSIITFLLLGITSIRGGLQEKPLMTSMAFNNNSMFLGNLTLNGAYTIINALYTNDHVKIPEGNREDSFRIIQKMYQNKSVALDDIEYPLMGTSLSTGQEKKYNIVIFILESFSAKDLTYFGSKVNAAPFLNKLIKKGYFFENAFATGQRSMAALPSIISSIPTLFGKLYINSAYQSNKQSAIGSMFDKRGYNTYFAYAAFDGSMGFSFYARIAGFKNVITQDYFKNSEKISDSTWGVYDHYTFLEMHRLFSDSKKPFASVIFSLHPHSPYQLPRGYKKYYPEDEPRSEFFNAMRYVDDSLRQFFRAAEKEDYFKNTIFIITADHVFGSRSGIERYHIPLLFYAPGIISSGKSTRTASQTDIIPSLIDLMNLRESYTSSGSSLFSDNTGKAFLDMSDLMGYVKDDYLLVVSKNNPVGLYNIQNDRDMQNNLVKKGNSSKTRIKEMNREWMAFYYSLVYSMVNNKFSEF